MRARPLTAMLLAWLLVGSGICLCLAAVPAQPAPDSHDCGSEPAVPASEDGTPCESDCTVDDAVRAPSGDRSVDQAMLCVGAVQSEVATEAGIGPACSHASRDSMAEVPQSAPAYILHSVLLI
ncbi:MAG: hypothetical protein OXJ37_23055 [Bryobacterales bacterium]|nr:hypothetical protein [Bryobacterales bacterium]